jgi:hypothetical protein
MAETDAGARGDPRELRRSVGAADRQGAVGRGDVRKKRRDEQAKQPEWQRMAYKVDQEETPARASYVGNKLGDFEFGEMVGDADGERDIGGGQGIADRVGANDGDECAGGWSEVRADDIDPESVADVGEDAAVGASDIEDAAHRERVAADRADQRSGIAEKAVKAREVAVGAGNDGLGKGVTVEDLRFVGTDHDAQSGTNLASVRERGLWNTSCDLETSLNLLVVYGHPRR